MQKRLQRGGLPQYLRGSCGCIYLFLLGMAVLLLGAAAAAALIYGESPFPGFWAICTSVQSLTIDATHAGSLSGALLNCGVLALAAVAILYLGKVEPDGTTLGAALLFSAFGLFGQNCLNVWPVLLGVLLYCRIRGEPFNYHASYALLGGALAPVASEILFSTVFQAHLAVRVLLALFAGALLGLFLPPLSMHALTMHRSHNLFNVGLSAGLLAILFYAVYNDLVLKPMGLSFVSHYLVGKDHNTFFICLLGGMIALSFIMGVVMNKGFKGLGRLLKSSGYGMDFVAAFGFGCVLINFSMLLAMALAYFLIIGASFTGPAVCSLVCMAAWAGKGAHVRNVLPIILGYCLTALISKSPLSLSVWVVGVCFATGMAPLAGRWGAHWGIIAGALHAALVFSTATFHGGFNLYNGGFTASLVAMVLVPLVEAVFKEMEHYHLHGRLRAALRHLFRRPAEGEGEAGSPTQE